MISAQNGKRPPPKRLGQARGRRSFSGELLDVSGASTFLGVTEKTLRARVSRRLVPFRRWGSRVCFLRAELIEFLKVLPGCDITEALQNDAERRGTE